MFHMNLTRTPNDTSAESLRKQFPHLEIKSGSPAKKPRGKPVDKGRAGRAAPTKTKDAGRAAPDASKSGSSVAAEKNKGLGLTLPDLNATPGSSASPLLQQQTDKKHKRPALSPVDSEEDDDDGEDVLTLEIPRGNPAAFGPTSNFSTTFRPFSELAREMRGESDEEQYNNNSSRGRTARGYEEELEAGYEEGDEYDENDEDDEEGSSRQPASPARHARADHTAAAEPERYTFDDGDEDSDAEGNDALDQDFGELEAELERALQNDGEGSDSSVSEEE